jgi:polyhydroxyalkanoate synthesis repressor PhaR
MSTTNESGSRRLDIRKYPNRRYYDATHSRHLTLEEIRRLIREGHDIKATDSKTGADITAQLLTQIILELETPKLDTFPVQMLVQMIRANERVVADFIGQYFTQAFTAYVDYQKQMEERFRQMHALPGGLAAPFAAWSQTMMNPFAAGQPAPSTARGGDEELRRVISELQGQVAGLKEQIKAKGARKTQKQK